MAPLRLAVAELDRDLPLAGVMSMDSVIDRQRNGNPFFTRVLGSFAVLALILAANRSLRAHFLFCGAKKTRDWHPYGARRRRIGRAATDPKRRIEDDRDRLHSRFGDGAATAQAFRCNLPRSSYWCAGGIPHCAHGNADSGSRGNLYSRATRCACQSSFSVAQPVTNIRASSALRRGAFVQEIWNGNVRRALGIERRPHK